MVTTFACRVMRLIASRRSMGSAMSVWRGMRTNEIEFPPADASEALRVETGTMVVRLCSGSSFFSCR